ncbi:MAG: PAS domain S-box protein [Campylobacterales bacterium]|nr:PAS domain S-box protein [Campylobacterales bacterium]
MLKLQVFDFDVEFSQEKSKHMSAEIKKSPIEFETRHKRKDDTIYNAAVLANMIELNGEMLFYTSIRDITEQKNSKEHLQKINIYLIQ